MALASRTFRIFVSSTFADLKVERDALQQWVFPRLRTLCEAHGTRFQAIDLRWGVSDEASLDQRTMSICLDEIDRCRRISPRPNFVVLLGDRYGWRPLPPLIPADELDQILHLTAAAADRDVLQRWYRRDDNASPPVYVLLPREGPYADRARWGEVERAMLTILTRAAAVMPLETVDRWKYGASATAQEIAHGALRVEDAADHVFCYFRSIGNLGDVVAGAQEIETARSFVDLDANGNLDLADRADLEKLKETLRILLPNNVKTYDAVWTGVGVSTDHIAKLCEVVYVDLARVILNEIGQLEAIDRPAREIADHLRFGQERARLFTGRAETLGDLAAYLARSDPRPLVLWGESGSGKSAVMARASQAAEQDHPHAVLVVRFIAASPESVQGRSLLESLCRQVSQAYGADETTIPTDYRELVLEFPRRLALATTDRPLFVFLDALDQLADSARESSLSWLPSTLPPHVRLVVSILPGAGQARLQRRLPRESLLRMAPLSGDEGEVLIDLWLKDVDRRLQPHQRQEVMARFAANGLPLYLRFAFEEARHWRSYAPAAETKLNPDVPGIIRALFTRLADDANHGPTLVARSLGNLAAARNGLAENELLDVLSPPYDREVLADFLRRSPRSPRIDRLPIVAWSRLFFDLEPYLSERDADDETVLSFYHRQFGEIAAADFLAGDESISRHQTLARYFADQPLQLTPAGGELPLDALDERLADLTDDLLREAGLGDRDSAASPNLRKLAELAYQQTHGELWDALFATLTDFAFLEHKARLGESVQTGADGQVVRRYAGVYQLQEEYDLALQRWPATGGEVV